jgi:type IV fimbrial biogenesis protein FimT
MHAIRGITLPELLCALFVITLLLGSGVPAMQSLVRDARLSGLVAMYLHAFNSARYTAVATHRQVTLCRLDAQGTCNGNWADDLTMFYDDNRDGALASHDDIIERIRLGSAEEIKVTLRAFGGTRHITLRGNGQFRRNGTLRFCPQAASKGRAIVINVTGRARTEQIDCPAR